VLLAAKWEYQTQQLWQEHLGSMLSSDVELAAQISKFSKNTGYRYSAYAFKYLKQSSPLEGAHPAAVA
jgi:hypothetical protein